MPTSMPSHAIHGVALTCLLSPNTWCFHLYLYAPVVQIPVMSKNILVLILLNYSHTSHCLTCLANFYVCLSSNFCCCYC